MPNHSEIYQQKAEQYHRLISKQPILLDVINRIRPAAGLDIVDLGAGTGRLTVPLAAHARRIQALDASEAMLQVTASRLAAAGYDNWQTLVADHRRLPLPDHSADLVVSGWSICYLCSTEQQNWQENLRDILREIRRILRPNGTVILFETMGTGTKTPRPPEILLPYYAALEREAGFAHEVIRADYTFDSLEEAASLSRFFFGDELAERVEANNWVTLPECAGVWWRTFADAQPV